MLILLPQIGLTVTVSSNLHFSPDLSITSAAGHVDVRPCDARLRVCAATAANKRPLIVKLVPCVVGDRAERGGQATAWRKRVWASAYSGCQGRAEAMATFTRRTLRRTCASIFSSLRRMVPQLASANCVCLRPIRRRAHSST